jgi:hypothetical protein
MRRKPLAVRVPRPGAAPMRLIVDIGVVSAAVSFIGPLLFNPTDARTRVLFVLAHYLLPARYWHPPREWHRS